MYSNINILARNALEQILPTVQGKGSLSKEKEIEEALEKTLGERLTTRGSQWRFFMEPFNKMERQVFLHITPDIKVIVRMVCRKNQ